jgi:hypothetical protein
MSAMDKLHKSARTYWQMVRRIPMSAGITRTPEFMTTLEYRRRLDTEFGADRVRKALVEAKE